MKTRMCRRLVQKAVLVLITVVAAGCAGGGLPDAETPSPPRADLASELGVETRVASLSQGEHEAQVCLLVADDGDKRSRGLSAVDSLAPFDGMLFVFERADDHKFWMKDTRIPLQLVPITADDTLSQPIEMQPCANGDCPTHGPDFAYEQAIEFAAGGLAKLEFDTSDAAAIDFTLSNETCS